MINELTDDQLIAKYHAMNAALAGREEARKHPKFNGKNAMAFPPPGDAFMSLKNEIDAEIKKRNLWI